MKILHITYSLAADQGGPSVVTTRLAAAQAALGHEVKILTRLSNSEELSVPGPEGGGPVQVERITGARGGTSTALEKVMGRDAMPLLIRLIPAHDVVHIHNIWDPILLHTTRIARAEGKPTVLSPHGILTRWAFSQKRFKKWIAMSLGYRRAIRQISLVHALSRFEEKELRALGLQGPVVRIPNAVSLEEIEPLPERGKFRAIHPELGHDPFVLFMSRLAPIKGVDLLVDTFSQVLLKCPSARLVIVGPDYGMGASIRRQIARLGIGERVHLYDPVFDRHKYEAMVDCACFCLPSGFEAFSVVIAEALACGAPVAISHECHFHEVEQAGAGLLVYRNVHSIAAALEKLLSDPGASELIGQAGRRLIKEDFTWEKVAERMIRAYSTIRAR